MADEPRQPEFPAIPHPPEAPPIPELLREQPARPSPASAKGPDSGMWGMAKAWGIALDFIFTIVAAGGLGWGFDYWRGTEPTGVMVGLALGFVLAFIRIVRTTMRQERDDEARRKAARRP